MSQENVQIMRRGYGPYLATGEIRARAGLVWDVSRLDWPEQQIYSGVEGAMQFNDDWGRCLDAPGRTGDQDADVREMYASVDEALDAVGLAD